MCCFSMKKTVNNVEILPPFQNKKLIVKPWREKFGKKAFRLSVANSTQFAAENKGERNEEKREKNNIFYLASR